MAKKTYAQMEFDSQEEIDFYWWCEEALDNELIHYFFTSASLGNYVLLDKQTMEVEGKKKFCFHGLSYTPDFNVSSDTPFFLEKEVSGKRYIIDIKGTFSKYNDEAKFSIIRKLMFYFHGVYVHKVVPEKLFLKTWVPEKCRYSPTGKLRRKYKGCKTISEYMEAKKKCQKDKRNTTKLSHTQT